jgi:hypothetical protein
MQKNTLLLLAFLAASVAHAQDSAKKYVLIEHFTNSNCSNCGSKNPAFYNLIDQYPADIHHISIHPPIPYSSCALYQANTTENSGRSNYYGIFGTPSLVINGESQPLSTPLLTALTLQNYLGQTSPVRVQVSETFNGNTRNVNVKVHSLDVVPGSTYKLYVAAVEKTLNYQGTNSETVHHDVFRDMVTDINGLDFTPATVGQFAEFNFSYTLNANWNANEMYTLAWVQRPSNKEVLNSGTRFDPVVSASGEPATQSIRIQPNPVTEVASAWIGDDVARQVEVFAGNGQRVSFDVESAQEGMVSIPAAELRPGIYYVKISGEKGVYVAKMVKN